MKSRCVSPGGEVTYIGRSIVPPVNAGSSVSFALAVPARANAATVTRTLRTHLETSRPRIGVNRSHSRRLLPPARNARLAQDRSAPCVPRVRYGIAAASRNEARRRALGATPAG